MASLKRLVYIFIPVLAVLLMSHNTFAYGNVFTPYTCYHTTAGNNSCQTYELTTGDTVDIISVTRANNLPALQNTGLNQHFLWALNVRSYGTSNQQFAINLANGYPDMATIDSIEQTCSTTPQGYTSCNILVSGTLLVNNWNLQLAGQVTAFGATYTIDSLYFSSDFNSDMQQYVLLSSIRDLLRNNPSPSAQDIADAIENKAEQNTQNAANDSQSAGSSSSQDATAATSSLISTIGGFVSAVTAASPTNCVINGNMGHLNMGNLDLCANPVPSYIQIIGSIILICAVIPLAIILFNRFIGLFRSFQG